MFGIRRWLENRRQKRRDDEMRLWLPDWKDGDAVPTKFRVVVPQGHWRELSIEPGKITYFDASGHPYKVLSRAS